jgi:hypothetical protein
MRTDEIDNAWEQFNENLLIILRFNSIENNLQWSEAKIVEVKDEIIAVLDKKIQDAMEEF